MRYCRRLWIKSTNILIALHFYSHEFIYFIAEPGISSFISMELVFIIFKDNILWVFSPADNDLAYDIPSVRQLELSETRVLGIAFHSSYNLCLSVS